MSVPCRACDHAKAAHGWPAVDCACCAAGTFEHFYDQFAEEERLRLRVLEMRQQRMERTRSTLAAWESAFDERDFTTAREEFYAPLDENAW